MGVGLFCAITLDFSPLVQHTASRPPAACRLAMADVKKQVLVPIADGSEEIEAVCIIDTLVRAGAHVTVASGMDQHQVTCSRGVKIVADALIGEVAFLDNAQPGSDALDLLSGIVVTKQAKPRPDASLAWKCAHPQCGSLFAHYDSARKHARIKHPQWVAECDLRDDPVYVRRFDDSAYVQPKRRWQRADDVSGRPAFCRLSRRARQAQRKAEADISAAVSEEGAAAAVGGTDASASDERAPSHAHDGNSGGAATLAVGAGAPLHASARGEHAARCESVTAAASVTLVHAPSFSPPSSPPPSPPAPLQPPCLLTRTAAADVASAAANGPWRDAAEGSRLACSHRGEPGAEERVLACPLRVCAAALPANWPADGAPHAGTGAQQRTPGTSVADAPAAAYAPPRPPPPPAHPSRADGVRAAQSERACGRSAMDAGVSQRPPHI
ncbi:hypothetical protein KFE25_011847 [Diacronema lutheri]|uniref:C2H2-type domain-containing protein n=1 Tax=Diacronema lutheri TaxID=2081491 RepID=A0A8J6C6S0_DIALT|nr:hypothetical protein KFE25_011847 [Diacronema lutheri]